MMAQDYVFGDTWANLLIELFSTDPVTRTMMRRLNLSLDDLNCYYLQQPCYNRVRAKIAHFLELDGETDPLLVVLAAIQAVKDETQMARGKHADMLQ